jgi:transposase
LGRKYICSKEKKEMINVEEWASIKILKEKGNSIKQIAKILKMSRNTVRKALRNASFKDYAGNTETELPKSRSNVAAYHEKILEMLVKKKFIGSRIFIELGKDGYSGSKTAFYEYLAKIKGSINLSKLSQRYETDPGVLSQFDWSQYSVFLDGILTKVFVFCTIVCYSRYRKYFASLDSKLGSVVEALEEAFIFFGGTTGKILVDNAKAMVSKRMGTAVKWNSKFLEFVSFYGVEPKACLPGKPKTKGKVENPFFYLEQHFIKGTKFDSFEDFCKKLEGFNSKVNARLHQGIGKIPLECFLATEKSQLKSLPIQRFIGSTEDFRNASYDCLISVDSNKYSVPYTYGGKQVWIRIVQGVNLKIYSQKAKLIATHTLSSARNQVIVNPTHYEGLKRKKISDKDLLMKMFIQAFPEKQAFADRLVAANRMNSAYHLFRILDTLKYYPKKEVEAAIARGLELNCYSANIIIGILRAGSTVKMEDAFCLGITKDIPQVDISRNLREYNLFGGDGYDG